MDLSKFGITKDELEKSKDIIPTFDISKLPKGGKVEFVFLEDEPRIIKTKDINSKEKDAKIDTPIINVFVERVIMPDDEAGQIEIPIQEKNGIYLSSKTLALGIARIGENRDSLKDIKVRVTKSTAMFKQGENTCYNVSEIEV